MVQSKWVRLALIHHVVGQTSFFCHEFWCMKKILSEEITNSIFKGVGFNFQLLKQFNPIQLKDWTGYKNINSLFTCVILLFWFNLLNLWVEADQPKVQLDQHVVLLVFFFFFFTEILFIYFVYECPWSFFFFFVFILLSSLLRISVLLYPFFCIFLNYFQIKWYSSYITHQLIQ